MEGIAHIEFSDPFLLNYSSDLSKRPDLFQVLVTGEHEFDFKLIKIGNILELTLKFKSPEEVSIGRKPDQL